MVDRDRLVGVAGMAGEYLSEGLVYDTCMRAAWVSG